jgi:hypothetical protein
MLCFAAFCAHRVYRYMQTAPTEAGIRPNSVTYVTAMRVASLHTHAATGLALALAVLRDATSTDATAAAPADVVIYNAALSVCARALKALKAAATMTPAAATTATAAATAAAAVSSTAAGATTVCDEQALQSQQISSNGYTPCMHNSSSNTCSISSHYEALQGVTLVLQCMAQHGVAANDSTVDVLVIINSTLVSALNSNDSSSSSSSSIGCSSTAGTDHGAHENAPACESPAALTDTAASATTATVAVTTAAGGLAAVYCEWAAAGLLSDDTLEAVIAAAAAAAAAAASSFDAHASKQKLFKVAAVRGKKRAGFELSHTRCAHSLHLSVIKVLCLAAFAVSGCVDRAVQHLS